MSFRRLGERGSAIISVLGWLLLLLPLAVWVSTAALVDVLQAQNARRAASAFYVAEAGLDRALAWVASQPSAEHAYRGPDGRAGSEDDGGVFGLPGQFVPFGEEAATGYQVWLVFLDSAAVRVRSRGRGWGGGNRTVEAIVRWNDGAPLTLSWNEEFEP